MNKIDVIKAWTVPVEALELKNNYNSYTHYIEELGRKALGYVENKIYQILWFDDWNTVWWEDTYFCCGLPVQCTIPIRFLKSLKTVQEGSTCISTGSPN